MEQEFIDTYNVLKNFGDKPDKQIAQQRGLNFEALINEIAFHENIQLSKSYYADGDHSEQIDGAIEVYNRVFLVEVKWVSSDEAASELYSFIGKIENKFHGTLGVFISKKELSQNFITALNRGRRQSVLIIHGNDIDELFTIDGPKLKDYLEHCFKLLSYRNITHFSVADYKKCIISKPGHQQTVINPPSQVTSSATNFIKQNFIDQLTTNSKMQMDFALLNLPDQTYILQYALKQWDQLIKIREQNPFQRDVSLDNLYTFFRSIDGKSEVVQKFSEQFYISYLLSNFGVYSDPVILAPFIDYFKQLSQEQIHEVGTALNIEFHRIEGNWDAENQLTFFIEYHWDSFSSDIQSELKQIYLDIFVSSSRQDRFAQKQFAIRLVREEIIDEAEIIKWLDERLRRMKENYEGEVSQGLIDWATEAYYPVMPYLSLYNWGEVQNFIHERLK